MVRPRDSRVSLLPSLSLSLFLVNATLEEDRVESISDKFRRISRRKNDGEKEEQNEFDSSNESRPWMTRPCSQSRSTERVGGKGPPTSGQPYPAERPPISRSARPCTLPTVPHNLLYRRPIVIDAIRAELLEIAPQNSSSYSSDKNFALGKGGGRGSKEEW